MCFTKTENPRQPLINFLFFTDNLIFMGKSRRPTRQIADYSTKYEL
jgi:hypothetical protein